MRAFLNTLKKLHLLIKGSAVLSFKKQEFKYIRSQFKISTLLEAEKLIIKDNEAVLLDLFLNEIQPGDIIYDIGANLGLYTLPALSVLNNTGQVFAFEPVPLWFTRLSENLSRNGFGHDRVTPIMVGLSNKEEEKDMVIKNIKGSGMGSVKKEYHQLLKSKETSVINVRLVHGDQFIKKYGIPQPNIVKIDVEGAELEVIQGFHRTLQDEKCRFILCEIHPQLISGEEDYIEKFLENLGYHTFAIKSKRIEYHLVARKK